MPNMNIMDLDLNLLLVFEALLNEGSVTRAARRLGRTQSAVSAALARLREALSDPVFIRSGHGVVPTQRALAIGGAVVRALADLREALDAGVDFEPRSSTRRFTIEMHEETSIGLLPTLMATMRKAAPRVSLRILPLEAREASTALATGTVDLAVGPFRTVGSAYDHVVLARPPYLIVARRGHPVIRASRRPTLAAYAACAHVLVSPRGRPSGVVDRALTERGKSRMTYVTASWSAALLAVQGSDLILTTPAWAAKAFAPFTEHVVAPVPLDLPVAEISMLWHRRSHTDLGLRWLRERIQESVPEAS